MQRRQLFSLTSALGLSFAMGGVAKANVATASIVPSAQTPLLLNFNENALGISPKAKVAVAQVLDKASRYADAYLARLCAKLEKLYGLTTGQVAVSAGSSVILQAAIYDQWAKAQKQGKAFQIVAPDPTYGLFADTAKAIGVSYVAVPLLKNTMGYDWATLKEKVRAFDGVSLVYLCNPNNPTGLVESKRHLNAWIEWAAKNQPNAFFVVDEAYAEYVTNPAFATAIRLVQKGYKNLMVARTFSKLYGLAGLRVGYGMADAKVLADIQACTTYIDCNLTGAVAAITTLDDATYLNQSLRMTKQSRAIVQATLKELGWKFVASEANFIFHEAPIADYAAKLKAQHIIVGRAFAPFDGWNRLTLGTPEEMKVWAKAVLALAKKEVK